MASGIQLFLTAAGSITITATDTVDSLLTSAVGTVQVNPNSAARLIVLRYSDEIQQIQTPGVAPGYSGAYPYGVTVTAGVPVAVTIVVVDQYFNTVVPPAGDNLRFWVWDGLSGVYAYSNSTTGLAPFAWNPNPTLEGRYDFTITNYYDAGDYSSLLAAPLNRFNYVTIQDTFYMFVDAPSSVVAGVPFSVTLTASTANYARNPASGASGYTFKLEPHLTISGTPLGHGTLTPEYATINSSGTTVVAASYTTAEVFTIIPQLFSPLGEKMIEQGSSQLINVMAALPAHLSVSATPGSVQSDHQAVVSVTVTDAYANVVPSVPVSFTLTAGSSGSTLSASSAVTNSSGVAQVTFTGGIVNETATVQAKVNTLVATVDIDVSVAAPDEAQMVNYPNPFDPGSGKTLVNYFLKDASDLEIRIYDAFGRIVLSRDLKSGEGTGDFTNATRAGGASFFWDGRNGEGRVVANGIYLIKLTARNSAAVQTFTRRVGVLK